MSKISGLLNCKMNEHLDSLYNEIEKDMESSKKLEKEVDEFLLEDEEITIFNLMDKQANTGCWCQRCCLEQTGSYHMFQMAVCPQCGNKRCPKASDHMLECSSSNESGQEGSIYL